VPDDSDYDGIDDDSRYIIDRISGLENGVSLGIVVGLVPGGGVVDQFANAARLERGLSRSVQIGKALGEFASGLGLFLAGGGEGAAGIGAIGSAFGAPAGVFAVAQSATLIVGGIANMGAGVAGLGAALMSSGSGESGKISETYGSIKDAPKYPAGFRPAQNGTVKLNVKNADGCRHRFASVSAAEFC
jgi:hypothetical protein